VSGCQNKKPVTKIRSTNGANTKHERRTTEQPEKKHNQIHRKEKQTAKQQTRVLVSPTEQRKQHRKQSGRQSIVQRTPWIGK